MAFRESVPYFRNDLKSILGSISINADCEINYSRVLSFWN